jgi:hypothetical protein
MTRTSLLAAVILLASAAPIWADEAEDAFNSLYGNEYNQVTRTPDKGDDVALAAELLKAAKAAEANPPLLALLCEKACELGSRDPKGYDTALAAADLLSSNIPEKAAACQDQVLAIRQRQYEKARGDDRVKTGEALIDGLVSTACDKARDGNFDEALRKCRQALTVARAIKSPNVAGIDAHIRHLLEQQKVAGKVPQIEETVKADPSNRDARNELIRLLLVELDNPDGAAKYVDDQCDANLLKYIPAAAKGVDRAPELACPELAQWYVDLAKGASPGGKAAMLARAKAYCERFLAVHTAQDKDRADASVTLTKVEADLKQLGPAAWTPPPKMVAAGQWLDLLAMADLQKDAHGGAWKRTTQGIEFSCGNKDPGLAFPVVPAGGYELEFTFIKKNEGGNTQFVVLPVGSASVVLLWSGSPPRLETVERKSFPANAPGARVHPGVWGGGRPCTVVVRVTLARDQATIAVLFDGQPQLVWTGPQAALSTGGPAASLPPRRPAIGADSVNGLVQSARLRMLPGGKAIPVRPLDQKQQAAPVPVVTQPADK